MQKKQFFSKLVFKFNIVMFNAWYDCGVTHQHTKQKVTGRLTHRRKMQMSLRLACEELQGELGLFHLQDAVRMSG